MYVTRIAESRLARLLKSFPAVAVVGARQVGKSTLVAHVLADRADTVVFDPVTDIENARRDPDLFLDNHRRPLVLDEIQYAPELVAAIKRRIDADRRPGQYVMTGSQQWGVIKAMAESLSGRVAFLDLDGFSSAEIAAEPGVTPWLDSWLENPQQAFSAARAPTGVEPMLYEQLWRGFLPEAQVLPIEAVGDFHEAYLRTYVERDVRLLADVSDLQEFGRFVRLSAALTAQEINHSQFGREIGVTPQTAQRWLGILGVTFQWFEAPAYSGNAIKRVAKKPKGYVADTGVACSLHAISSPKALSSHPLLGAVFETCVVAELRKQAAVISPRPTTYHWRSAGGAEVDVVLERDGRLFPIEIKRKTNPSASDGRGIGAFRNSYPQLDIAPGLVLAPISRPLRLGQELYALPWNAVMER